MATYRADPNAFITNAEYVVRYYEPARNEFDQQTFRTFAEANAFAKNCAKDGLRPILRKYYQPTP